MFHHITTTDNSKSSQHPEYGADAIENRCVLKTESKVHCTTLTSSIGHSDCHILVVVTLSSCVWQLCGWLKLLGSNTYAQYCKSRSLSVQPTPRSLYITILSTNCYKTNGGFATHPKIRYWTAKGIELILNTHGHALQTMCRRMLLNAHAQ